MSYISNQHLKYADLMRDVPPSDNEGVTLKQALVKFKELFDQGDSDLIIDEMEKYVEHREEKQSKLKPILVRYLYTQWYCYYCLDHLGTERPEHIVIATEPDLVPGDGFADLTEEEKALFLQAFETLKTGVLELYELGWEVAELPKFNGWAACTLHYFLMEHTEEGLGWLVDRINYLKSEGQEINLTDLTDPLKEQLTLELFVQLRQMKQRADNTHFTMNREEYNDGTLSEEELKKAVEASKEAMAEAQEALNGLSALLTKRQEEDGELGVWTNIPVGEVILTFLPYSGVYEDVAHRLGQAYPGKLKEEKHWMEPAVPGQVQERPEVYLISESDYVGILRTAVLPGQGLADRLNEIWAELKPVLDKDKLDFQYQAYLRHDANNFTYRCGNVARQFIDDTFIYPEDLPSDMVTHINMDDEDRGGVYGIQIHLLNARLGKLK